MFDVSRKELKYIVSPHEISGLKRRLSPLMRSDPHNGGQREGYRVRSLYFDTPFDTDYEEKISGCQERRKIRLRIYDPSDQTVKLELKEKNGTAQRKRSILLDREEAACMIRGEYGFLREHEEELALHLYLLMTQKCYRPKCVVEYDRYAYCLEHNETRVTFDTGLRSGESSYDIFDKNMMLYPVGGVMANTLEVKFNGFLFTYIKNELNRCQGMPTSNSKYCRGRMTLK